MRLFRTVVVAVLLGSFFSPAIAFEHYQSSSFDFLVSCKPMTAGDTLSSSSDSGAFSRGTRVDDLIVLTTAFRTAHM